MSAGTRRRGSGGARAASPSATRRGAETRAPYAALVADACSDACQWAPRAGRRGGVPAGAGALLLRGRERARGGGVVAPWPAQEKAARPAVARPPQPPPPSRCPGSTRAAHAPRACSWYLRDPLFLQVGNCCGGMQRRGGGCAGGEHAGRGRGHHGPQNSQASARGAGRRDHPLPPDQSKGARAIYRLARQLAQPCLSPGETLY